MGRALCIATLWMGGCGQEYNIGGPIAVDPALITDCPFSPVSGTQFRRYDCNPVFTGSDEAWATSTGSVGFHVSEVLGHAFYQMWYATPMAGGDGMGIGYAVSAEGTAWEALPTNPGYQSPPRGWNRDSLGATNVVWDSNEAQYVMAYQGVNFDSDGNGLGLLLSPDGRTWTEANDGRPTLDLSAVYDGVSYCWPLGLTHDPDSGFHGFIGGTRGAFSGNQACEIYGYGGPTLEEIRPGDGRPLLPAGQGIHDEMGASDAAVVQLDGTWYMFYVGIHRWQPIDGTNFVYAYNTSVNLATSADGVTWTKSDDNPILQLSVLDETPYRIGSIAAQVVGPRVHLWIDDYYPDLDATAVGYFLFEPDVSPHP